jgi:hypothetical protein
MSKPPRQQPQRHQQQSASADRQPKQDVPDRIRPMHCLDRTIHAKDFTP